MLIKTALMGNRSITVLQSSGDFGVGVGCLSNDARNKTHFEPIFPGTCPCTLSVGSIVGASLTGSASEYEEEGALVQAVSATISHMLGTSKKLPKAISKTISALILRITFSAIPILLAAAFPDVSAGSVEFVHNCT